jgi:hypothetical protein
VEIETDELAELAPEVRKARTFTTLVQFCIHSSQSCPLILEVEDLYWSDAISAEWLTALIERVGHVPLLVLGTYRLGYRPAWLDKSYATQVALQPLSPSDSRRIVQGLLPMTQRSAALEPMILAKADGNPFFLEELAQTVVEQGRHAPALGVPATVQAVLAARIGRLPPAEKRLLQIAAVIGSEVPVPLLHAIAALRRRHCTVGSQPRPRLARRPVPRSRGPGARHPGMRQIAATLGYASALQGRLAEGRVLLEEAISEAIRTGGLLGLATRVARLSEVCRLAGHGEEAWQHARQALDLARQHKARGDEAHALYQLGVVHAHAVPPMPSRPKPITSRPWPWPMNSVCAHSWPTATTAWARCMPRAASGSRPAPPWPQPSPCTGPWR